MLCLKVTKRRMVKLAQAMGYAPSRDADFFKLRREPHWWLEWVDGSAYHSLGIFSSYNHIVLTHDCDISDGAGYWHCDIVPVELLLDCDLLIDTATC